MNFEINNRLDESEEHASQYIIIQPSSESQFSQHEQKVLRPSSANVGKYGQELPEQSRLYDDTDDFTGSSSADDNDECGVELRGCVDQSLTLANGGESYAATRIVQLQNHGDVAVARRLCLVCEDVASGLHYGVSSCEACKAFFKRTVQGNITYNCPASGTCEITKRRRKACQACRFQKCISMGMLKEGVRPDRVRGGRQKYRGVSDSSSYADQSQATNSSDCDEVVWSLMTIEPEQVYAIPDQSLPDTEYMWQTALSDLTDRELVATIGWAKQVTGFPSLSLSDQMTLLQNTWLDIICLNIVYRSTPYNDVIVYADDFKCAEGDSSMRAVSVELDSALRKLTRQQSGLEMSKVEYVVLKAMLLFNPDIEGLKSPARVQQLRDRILDALTEVSQTAGGSAVHRRVCALLHCIAALAQVRMLAHRYWLDVKKSGRVALHKLMSEILDLMVV